MASAIYERSTGKIVAVHMGIATATTADKYRLDPKTHGVLTGLSNDDLVNTEAVLVKGGKLVQRCRLRVTVNGQHWDENNPFVVKADGKAFATVTVQKLDATGKMVGDNDMLDIFPDHPRVIPVEPDDKLRLSQGSATFKVGPFDQTGELAILVFDEHKVMKPDNIHVKFKR